MFASLGKHKYTIGLVVIVIGLGFAVYGGIKGYYNGVTLEAISSGKSYYNGAVSTLNDKVSGVVTAHDGLAARVQTLESEAAQFNIDKTQYDARLKAVEDKLSAPKAVPVYTQRRR